MILDRDDAAVLHLESCWLEEAFYGIHNSCNIPTSEMKEALEHLESMKGIITKALEKQNGNG